MEMKSFYEKFNLIFFVLSILLIIAGSYRNLTFLPIIIANTLIGIIQEIRAKNVLSKMNMLHTPYVNVLCVDKTGTITKNEMKVCELINLNEMDLVSERKQEELISDFVSVLDSDNITMQAMKAYFVRTTNRHCSSKYGFSPTYKYSAVEFPEGNYVLGAPEFVLRSQYENYQSQVEELTLSGKRVLVFGEYKGKLTGKELVSEVIPMALITLANPIRENAKQTFRYFAKQDVQIKVISGDNPLTVSKIAKEAGIEGSENYIDASTIKNNKQLIDALRKYTVFGRVTPEQKRQIVQCLQKLGNTVAMTGDGVNDVLALKDADCRIYGII